MKDNEEKSLVMYEFEEVCGNQTEITEELKQKLGPFFFGIFQKGLITGLIIGLHFVGITIFACRIIIKH